ncbi:MAG: hypothetical protein ACRCW1_00630 [Anaerotignaceae bacterium]
MKNQRMYALYCMVQFAIERKNFVDNAFYSTEKALLKKSYDKILLDIKEILLLEDTLDILELSNYKIVLPVKYYSKMIELLPVNNIIKNDKTITIKTK